jgi:hypothetical protein
MYDVLLTSEREGWTRQLMRASLRFFGDNPRHRSTIRDLERELISLSCNRH